MDYINYFVRMAFVSGVGAPEETLALCFSPTGVVHSQTPAHYKVPIKGGSPPPSWKTSIRIDNPISPANKCSGHMVSKGGSFHHKVIIRPADCYHSSGARDETHC